MKNVDWENVDITGHGFEIMKNPQKAYEIMGLTQANNMPVTGNSSNTRSAVLSGNKSTKTKTSATTTAPKQEKKKGFGGIFQETEPLYSKSPMFTKTYDWQKNQKERMQRFGVAPTTQTTTQRQEPALIRKTSAIDPDAEELTPAGEAAFLKGFNSIYEDDEMSPFTKVQSIVNAAKKQNDKISFLGNIPLDKDSYNWGTYQYIDRNLTEAKNRYKPVNSKNGLYSPESPNGRFGIALSDSPEIANVSEKNQINYIFGLDTKYSDQKGNLQPSTVPNRVFNRDAIKLLKTGGKAVSVAGDVIQMVDTGLNIYGDYRDDGRLGKQTVKDLVGVAGDFGGAALGAKAGAALFSKIAGVFSGGVLAAPAAAAGGIIGGISGGIWGEEIAEGAFELFV